MPREAGSPGRVVLYCPLVGTAELLRPPALHVVCLGSVSPSAPRFVPGFSEKVAFGQTTREHGMSVQASA